MNREQRRSLEKALPAQARAAQGYILITFNRQGKVEFSGDASGLNDKEDARQIAFRGMFDESRALVHGINENRFRSEAKAKAEEKQSTMVETIKEQRSEQLAKTAIDAKEEVRVESRAESIFGRPSFVSSKREAVATGA
jgi:hypothetical protein